MWSSLRLDSGNPKLEIGAEREGRRIVELLNRLGRGEYWPIACNIAAIIAAAMAIGIFGTSLVDTFGNRLTRAEVTGSDLRPTLLSDVRRNTGATAGFGRILHRGVPVVKPWRPLGTAWHIALLCLLPGLAYSTGPGQPTGCKFQALPPSLNFGLKYEAGYILRVPVWQLTESGQSVEIRIIVAPQQDDDQSTLVVSRVNLPAAASGMETQIRGRFSIDPGSWRVRATAVSETGTACSGEWDVEVDRKREPVRPSAALDRVTIMIDATSADAKASALMPGDIAMLTGGLAAMLKRFHARSVRVVVFNLDRQTEFMRADDFHLADLRHMAAVLRDVRLGTIEYRNLATPGGPGAFVDKLIEREAGESPDRIVFFGASAQTSEHAYRLTETQPCRSTGCYYLQYRPDWRATATGWSFPAFDNGIRLPLPGPPLVLADTIERTMRRFHGRTLSFSSAEGFADALHKVAP